MADPNKSVALTLDGLTTSFRVGGAWHPAIRGISLSLMPNETLALVGESGCGKSITALSIMRLVPEETGRIESGRILYGGQDIARLSEAGMRKIRGNRISMIFQEPMTSLNPVLTVGFQIAEALIEHQGMSRREADTRAKELLELVRIPSATERMKEYPHQFSGGMRQRVMIAMAIACKPDILLADEPTTALDVTIQSQVLALLVELKKQNNMSMLFITHNLGVVAAIADRVAVMYAGDIVELAPVEDLFARPTHPYTELLLRSIPRSDREISELTSIPGRVPPIDRMPPACRFAARCPLRVERCTQELPQLAQVAGSAPGHQARCWVRAPQMEDAA